MSTEDDAAAWNEWMRQCNHERSEVIETPSGIKLVRRCRRCLVTVKTYPPPPPPKKRRPKREQPDLPGLGLPPPTLKRRRAGSSS